VIFFCWKRWKMFTPVMEIKPNRVSLRWNFYIQLIRGRFWLQLWTVKKFSEPRVSWKYLAIWKNSKMPPPFAATVRRWADGLSLFTGTALHCRQRYGHAQRSAVHPSICEAVCNLCMRRSFNEDWRFFRLISISGVKHIPALLAKNFSDDPQLFARFRLSP